MGAPLLILQAENLGRELKVNLDFYDKDVPPTATMEGIDLVTEGVLTLSKAIEKLSNYEASFAGDRTVIVI